MKIHAVIRLHSFKVLKTIAVTYQANDMKSNNHGVHERADVHAHGDWALKEAPPFTLGVKGDMTLASASSRGSSYTQVFL